MVLTKNEINFIRLATILADGVFDYSVYPQQFKASYGLTKKESYEMTALLNEKCNQALNKIHSKEFKKTIAKHAHH